MQFGCCNSATVIRRCRLAPANPSLTRSVLCSALCVFRCALYSLRCHECKQAALPWRPSALQGTVTGSRVRASLQTAECSLCSAARPSVLRLCRCTTAAARVVDFFDCFESILVHFIMFPLYSHQYIASAQFSSLPVSWQLNRMTVCIKIEVTSFQGCTKSAQHKERSTAATAAVAAAAVLFGL